MKARLLVLLGGLGVLLASGALSADDRESVKGPSDVFFDEGQIPKLRLEVPPEEVAKLEADPRNYVRAELREENGKEKAVYVPVGVKLKGAAGSFRPLDQKPGLTINTGKFGGETRFHGLVKFYLNNSVQDETYLRELLATELFRAAKVPAPRVTHARVWFNGRDLGLYVLKEGYDKRFLRRNFENPDGNLYDGGFCQDIDTELERDEGKGPEDRSDLMDLAAACAETEALNRHQLIPKRLDVDAFITFMAVERMTGHWDGYCTSRNNFRIYFDPVTGRAQFLPHGMDQVFEDAEASILDKLSTIVAAAVLKDPEWKAKYRERVTELLPLFAADKLQRRLDQLSARLKPVLGAMRDGPQGVSQLRDLLGDRAKFLVEQSKLPEGKPVSFAKKKTLALRNWSPTRGAGAPRVDADTTGNVRSLRIQCVKAGTPAVGTWTCTLLLEAGKYRFEANAAVDDVDPTGEADKAGAGIRTSDAKGPARLVGSKGWTSLECDFEVTGQPREIDLLCELSALKGEARFKLSSLRLTKLDG